MHYLRKTALCLVFIVLTYQSWSQNQFFERTFGTDNNESCFSFIHTSDNGYAILGGTSASPAGGFLDFYFSKLDSNENLQWTKAYGGAGAENGNCIKQTLDGGYIICGEQNSFGAGLSDGFLVRTDSQGTILWSKSYGLAQSDVFGKIEITSDSNYIIVGTTFSPGNQSGDIMVVKVNDSGDTLWTRIIGGPVYDAGINLTVTNDGGCVICGRVYSYGAGLRDVMLSRIDGNGNVLWFKTYGGIGTEEGMAVTHSSDNGYVITGATETFSLNGLYDVYMIKTDSIGDLIWSKTYGGDKIDATYAIVEAPDGGYVVTGFTDSWAYLHLRSNIPLSILGDDSSHVFLMKVNSAGDTVWTRAFGGTTVDEAYALINAPDGGYIIGAYGNSFSLNDSLDAYIIHTDSFGMSDCHTYIISPYIGNPATIVNSHTPTVFSGLIITNTPTVENTIAFVSSDPCLPVLIEESNAIKTKGVIYPNPFSTSAIILFEKNYDVLTINVYDVFGKKVRTETDLSSTGQINIERKNLKDGIYFVEVNSAEKKVFRSKIIINGTR